MEAAWESQGLVSTAMAQIGGRSGADCSERPIAAGTAGSWSLWSWCILVWAEEGVNCAAYVPMVEGVGKGPNPLQKVHFRDPLTKHDVWRPSLLGLRPQLTSWPNKARSLERGSELPD